jgi:hypothetical protein
MMNMNYKLSMTLTTVPFTEPFFGNVVGGAALMENTHLH